MENIIDRLFKYMEYSNLNSNSLTVIADLSVGLLGKALKSHKGLHSDTIEKILHSCNDLNPTWLMTGKGDMRNPPPDDYYCNPDFPEYTGGELDSLGLFENKAIGIPLIPIEAMAGFGQGSEQVLELDCERFVVPTFRGADYLIQIKGSSMYPKYNSGDIVACKNLVLADAFFQWNKVYVLDTDQGALIKRVKKSTAENTISLVSDNLNYDPFDMELNKIHAIAIVMGVIRME